jgi:hypothetical protein
MAPFRFHRRHVKNKIGSGDSGSRAAAGHHSALLASGVARSTNLQSNTQIEANATNSTSIYSHVEMGLGHLHLPAHGLGLAGVFAVDVGFALSKENLVVFAFPAERKSAYVADGVLISPKSKDSPIKSNYIGSLSNHQCLFPKVNSLRQNCVLRTESGSI